MTRLVLCGLRALLALLGSSYAGIITVKKTLVFLQVALDHMPFSQSKSNSSRAKRQTAQEFAPIRITPYFVNQRSSSDYNITGPNGPVMRAIELLSNTLLVRPIEGNITIPPECTEWTYGRHRGKCRYLHTNTECGIFRVPAQFVGTREVCSSRYSYRCYERGPDGEGASDTDFLLFVGTEYHSKEIQLM